MSTITTKHRQGTYTLPDGTVRVINAQRVDGHVRLTDEPEVATADSRRYIIQREVEADPVKDGTSASAHMNAIVADYLEQARRLRRCPLERDSLLTETRASHMVPPKALKVSPFDLMQKFGVDTFADAIAARAAARQAEKAAVAA
jgi:hypothetical protein